MATVEAKEAADAKAAAVRTAEYARLREHVQMAAMAREQGCEATEYAAAVLVQAVWRGAAKRSLDQQWRIYWAAEAAATKLQALRRGRVGRRRARLMKMYHCDKVAGSRKKDRLGGTSDKRGTMRSAAFQAFAAARQPPSPAPAPAPAAVDGWGGYDQQYDEQQAYLYQYNNQAQQQQQQQQQQWQDYGYTQQLGHTQHDEYGDFAQQQQSSGVQRPTLVRGAAAELMPSWAGEHDDFAEDEVGGNWGASLGTAALGTAARAAAGDDEFGDGFDEFEQSSVEAEAPTVSIDYALTLISSGYVDQIKAMLQGGSLLATARDRHQNTLLHHAAASGAGKRDKRAMCEILIQAGADVNARNAQGKTVLGQCDPDIDRKLMAFLSTEMGGVQ